VISATPKVRQHEEIQRYRGYVDVEVPRAESTFISISPDPDRDPHSALCHFLAESDSRSVYEIGISLTESRFRHWDKVYSSCPLKIQTNIYVRR
jgi:hypothetical protein